ncbi:MAG TPA: nuclear transport factor 2 family protein [Pyrinomonadaceae bacterium]|nr:nuclear transport factor 2 family protein [Pyrinomonadaceae bacterium]
MTTRLPLVIVLTLVFASFAHAQTTGSASASPTPSPTPKPAMSRAQSQRMIIATERKLWEAWKNKDMKPFRANITADAVMIGDSGVADKKTSLSAMESMACDVKSYELSDIKVTFLSSSTAIMTYKSAQDATCAGQAVPPTVWSSSVYVLRGGRWLAASHQETPAR